MEDGHKSDGNNKSGYVITTILLVTALVGILLQLASATIFANFLGKWPELAKIIDSVGTAAISASIIGMTYEFLLRREVMQQEDERLRRIFSRFTNETLQHLPSKVMLEQGVSFLSEEQQTKTLRSILDRMAGSPVLSHTLFDTILESKPLSGKIWKQTRHHILLSPADDLNSIRMRDVISYYGLVSKKFRVGFFRDPDSRYLEAKKGSLDAFWISAAVFNLYETTDKRTFDVFDFTLTKGKDKQALDTQIPHETDGACIFEFDVPEEYQECQVRISYTLRTLTSRSGLVQITLPNASEGLEITVQSKIPNRTTFAVRTFAPDSAEINTTDLGNGEINIATKDVLLRGHGAIILLKRDDETMPHPDADQNLN